MTAAAFRLPLRELPWPVGKHEPRPCPICGQGWIPWAGSKLPCHGRCLLTPEAQRECLESQDSTRALMDRYGVTESVIRASIAAARNQQRARLDCMCELCGEPRRGGDRLCAECRAAIRYAARATPEQWRAFCERTY